MSLSRVSQLWILAAFSCLVLLLAPSTGPVFVSPIEALRGEGLDAGIYWNIRMPRVLASFIAGASLAVSGMAFQALFRSPLATPFTLGVASGASFAAALAAFLGLTFTWGGYSFPGLFALVGAGGSVLLVYSITRLKRSFSVDTLLLAGVAINYCFASAVVCLQYLSDYSNIFRVLRALLGGFEGFDYPLLIGMLPFVLPGMFVLAGLCYELNLIAQGEDVAIGRGMDIVKTRKILFVITSMMVGGVVAVAGPIGFIGLMAPHICRLLVGSNHRFLMPATVCIGGMLLAICDTLARTVISPGEIPVGVLTSLLGGPFFIWLLLTRKETH